MRESPLFDVPRVTPALSDCDGRAARAAARQMKRGDIVYPRLMVLDDQWVRQDYEGGPLCGVEAA